MNRDMVLNYLNVETRRLISASTNPNQAGSPSYLKMLRFLLRAFLTSKDEVCYVGYGSYFAIPPEDW